MGPTRHPYGRFPGPEPNLAGQLLLLVLLDANLSFAYSTYSGSGTARRLEGGKRAFFDARSEARGVRPSPWLSSAGLGTLTRQQTYTKAPAGRDRISG
jgi:hypothetical protein